MLVRLSFGLALAAAVANAAAAPVLLDFESLPDGPLGGSEFVAQGVATVQGALALSAGFSLNEFDFPPHSGGMALGNAAPAGAVELLFSEPIGELSAWFTYSAPLSISSYAADGTLMGTVLSLFGSNVGASERIDFGFMNVARVVIASAGDYILDDLQFSGVTSGVPEPSSAALGALALAAAAWTARRSRSQPPRLIPPQH